MAITRVYQDQIERIIASAHHSANTAAYSGTVKFTTEIVDTHNAFNHTTGIFTCPKAGLYYISYSGFTDMSASNGAIYVRKNGANFGSRNYTSTASNYMAISIQLVVPCAEGDTLNIQADMLIHGNNNSQISIIYYGEV